MLILFTKSLIFFVVDPMTCNYLSPRSEKWALKSVKWSHLANEFAFCALTKLSFEISKNAELDNLSLRWALEKIEY